jgi:hypothetical protein
LQKILKIYYKFVSLEKAEAEAEAAAAAAAAAVKYL